MFSFLGIIFKHVSFKIKHAFGHFKARINLKVTKRDGGSRAKERDWDGAQTQRLWCKIFPIVCFAKVLKLMASSRIYRHLLHNLSHCILIFFSVTLVLIVSSLWENKGMLLLCVMICDVSLKHQGCTCSHFSLLITTLWTHGLGICACAQHVRPITYIVITFFPICI